MANHPVTLKEFLPFAIQVSDILGNIHGAGTLNPPLIFLSKNGGL